MRSCILNSNPQGMQCCGYQGALGAAADLLAVQGLCAGGHVALRRPESLQRHAFCTGMAQMMDKALPSFVQVAKSENACEPQACGDVLGARSCWAAILGNRKHGCAAVKYAIPSCLHTKQNGRQNVQDIVCPLLSPAKPKSPEGASGGPSSAYVCMARCLPGAVA